MVSDAQFEEWVKEGITLLPLWVQEKIVNVVFLVREKPNARERKEEGLRNGEILFGLYDGVPLTERGDESPPMPDTITIFKYSVLEAYEREEDVRACIHNTVWHEVAHYFGHDEEWVSEEERKRGKVL